uniref:GRAM domain-containing protein n=1 Tax=Caenorhabditis japonica TaxID=281687 RepID=A0A8R1DZP3_CAEJA
MTPISVSTVAELADQDATNTNTKKSSPSMVRGGPPHRTSSPRPLILQNHSKWRNEESSSISSADSALEELGTLHESAKNQRWEWLRREAKSFVDDVINAFESGSQEEFAAQQDNEKLSAVQLRKDIKRFYSAVNPYLEVLAALYDIIMWKNPLSTLLLVIVIVYSLYRGWLAALLIGLLLFQLSINYLSKVKNIDLGWMFLPRKAVTLPKFDISGAQLIFDIAKLAQKLLRLGTNILEKMESLLLWKDVKVTRVFYILVVYWFGWSVLFATGTCIGWTVLTIGIRIFFTTYLFQKFPRLRKRFDTYGYFYRNLPLRSTASQAPPSTATSPRSQPQSTRSERNVNNQETDDRCITPSAKSLNAYCGEKFESRLGSNFNLDQGAAVNLLLGSHLAKMHSPTQQYDSPAHFHIESDSLDSPVSDQNVPSEHHEVNRLHGSSSLPTSDQMAAHRIYAEPPINRAQARKSSSIEVDEDDESEHLPLCADPIIDNVIAFRSCVMNERERLFPMGITPGILYLTDAALVFRPRNNSDEKEQLMMLFHDLKQVKKTQSLRSMSLITGTRKSLEIHVDGRRKPVQFIGLAKRDDFVTRIMLMCRNASAEVEFADQPQ